MFLVRFDNSVKRGCNAPLIIFERDPLDASSKSKNTWVFYVLWLGLCLTYIGWWHSRDTRPVTWDPSVHLGLAIDYRDWLLHRAPLTNSRTSMYPPFYHLSLIPSLLVGVPSEAKAVTTHALYAAAFLMALLGLARKAGRPAADAFIAALLVFSYPIFHIMFLFALTDVPLLVLVTVGMGLLYKSDDFTDLRFSLAWGFVSGLGFLVKQPYPFFFILPCAWLLLRRRQDAAPRRLRLRNCALACLLLALVSVPWYWWEGIYAIQNGLGQAFERGVAQHNPDFRSVAGWLCYAQLMPAQMYPWGLAATVIGLALLPFSRADRRMITFLGLWALSGYVGLTFIHNKDPRYDMAILPALAFLSVLGWTGASTSSRRRRGAVMAGVSGLLLWNVLRFNHPLKEDWKHAEIGRVLAARHDPDQPFLIASVEANDAHFFGRTLRWSLRRQGILLYNAAPGDPMADFTEFVITKSGNLGPDPGPLAEEWRALRDSGRRFTVLFPQVAEFPLPDGSRADIYQCDRDHIFQVGPVTKPALQSRLREALAKLIEGPLTVAVEGEPDRFKTGRIDDAVIAGGPWSLRGIPIARAELRIHKARLNLYTLWDDKKPGLLAFEAIEPRLEIRASDLQKLLVQKVRELSEPTVRFAGGRVIVAARWKNIPLKVELKIALAQNPDVLQATLARIRIGWVPITPWLLGRARQFELPLYPTPPFPGRILIHQVVLENDILAIS